MSIEFIITILERPCLPIPAILRSNTDFTSQYISFYFIKIGMPQYIEGQHNNTCSNSKTTEVEFDPMKHLIE